MGTLPYPGDQIIDADMASALHADACGECQDSCRLNYVMILPIDEATALAA